MHIDSTIKYRIHQLIFNEYFLLMNILYIISKYFRKWSSRTVGYLCMSGGNQSLSLWENFIESIAQVLSKALTNDDTEKLLSSFETLQERLRQLSV